MIRQLLLYVFLLGACSHIKAQTPEETLNKVKQRLDNILQFTADVRLSLDIDFIRMPDKTVGMIYKKGERVKVSSYEFFIIPKRGLDFSFQELFAYPYVLVDRGKEKVNGIQYLLCNIIPTDPKSDLVMAMLSIDEHNNRIQQAEVNTKKDGTYKMVLHYANANAIVPDKITVGFMVEKLRLPLNFVGKQAEIDKAKLKEAGIKEGRIFLALSNIKMTGK